ncbi:MAG: PAS domain-containing sensor histidine kinase, partial [Bacteroidota bacterium]
MTKFILSIVALPMSGMSDLIDISLHALLTIPVVFVFAKRPMTELFIRSEENLQMADTTYDRLVETNEYLTSLFTYANVPIVVWDPSLKITQFNNAFEKLTGYSSVEVRGQKIDILFPHYSANESLTKIRNTSTTEDRWETVEIPIQCKSGQIRTILWNSANVMTKSRDAVAATIAQGYDITNRIAAQKALAESNELLNSLMKYSPIYIFIKEVNPVQSRVLRVSENFHHMTGIPAGDMIGKTMSELFPQAFAEKIISDDWESFSEGKSLQLAEHLNGRDYHTVKFPFMIGERKVLGGFTIDVTEREQAAKQLQGAMNSLRSVEKDLREKNTELERFTYTVSHDLKSPLITIKGYAGGLMKDIAKGRTDRFETDLMRISSAADKMTGLLEDLLQLSRIGRVANPPTEFSLNDAVNDVLGLLAGPIEERNASVIVHDLPSVNADRGRIQEVFQNLVENALKFVADQKEPKIEIGQSVHANGERVVCIRDNGRGIDRRYLETIFGLFNKLDTASVGSGIGLAVVRRIIEVHGGKIWAESGGIGTGATFYLT